MIRARLNHGLFILGIDAENVKRLKEGKPIMVSLAELGGSDDVCIMYGETMQAIAAELERASGAPLPPATPINEARNTQ
jgi:hypothetical protein